MDSRVDTCGVAVLCVVPGPVPLVQSLFDGLMDGGILRLQTVISRRKRRDPSERSPVSIWEDDAWEDRNVCISWRGVSAEITQRGLRMMQKRQRAAPIASTTIATLLSKPTSPPTRVERLVTCSLVWWRVSASTPGRNRPRLATRVYARRLRRT